VYVAEERPPTHDIYTYSKITTITANALYYMLQYECVCGPTGTKEKYLPLYSEILSTITFGPPSHKHTPKASDNQTQPHTP
jgi:hypothetical protein